MTLSESELPSTGVGIDAQPIQNPIAPSEIPQAPATPAPSKKSPKEFAQLIKEKYPLAYDDIPDDELAKKVITKYPVYQDMVDLSGVTKQTAEEISPSQLKVSPFQKQLAIANQPTSGQVQVGQSPFSQSAGGVAIPASAFDGLDPAKTSNLEYADAVTRATWGLPLGQLQELYSQAGLAIPDLEEQARIGEVAKQNHAWALGHPEHKIVVVQQASTFKLREALAEYGVAGFNSMAQQLREEDTRVQQSIHQITPEETAKVEEARRSVSWKLGLANATLAQNEYWTNLLGLLGGSTDPSGKLRENIHQLNIIPGTGVAKQQLAQSQALLPEFYKNQSNLDAFIELIPSTALTTTRMLAAAATGSAVSQATTVGPAIGSLLGIQADTGLQNLDKPLSTQVTNQLITLAMSGAGVSAGVARNVLAANGVYVPNFLYIPAESSLMALGSYGAMEILSPEATFQQKLANSIIGGLLPLGFAAARGLTPRPPLQPKTFEPAGLLGPAPEGGPIPLGETFPVYENKYPSEYKVNLSRPGENPLEFQYQPGEQIPLFDAVIGGQRARAHIYKGLSSLTDGELQEAYIQAGGADHNLPSDRGDLITSIMDLHSSKFPLMEATTENAMPVISQWAGVEHVDQLMETPFQYGKTYRVLEDGRAWWKVEDMDNPGHVYRIGKYEPAGLAANIETVITPGLGEMRRTLVVPDFTGPKLETQPLLFPEPENAQPAQGGGPRYGTTDREGAQARLQLLAKFMKGDEFKNLPSKQKQQVREEASQLRKEILTPSGGRNQVFVPRFQAERHLQNLVGFIRRPEFSELPPEYQALVKQEVADLDFLLNKQVLSPEEAAKLARTPGALEAHQAATRERQARLYQGILSTEGNSFANTMDRAVNQVGAEGPKLLSAGQYELPAGEQGYTGPKLRVSPDRDFQNPPAGADLGVVPIAQATREISQLRSDWAEYNSQLDLYKRTEEYQKLTWREKEQLEPDTQRVPLPKRLSESQVGKGKRSKVESTAKERGWTIKAPAEGKGKAYPEMLRAKERALQAAQNTPEPLETPQEPSPLVEALGLPVPSEAASSTQLPADGTIPVNPGTNLFGVRSVVRELLSRREQKSQARAQLGDILSRQIPNPDENPLWQMITQLPTEELRTQLSENGVDISGMRSKAVLQKALYSTLAPVSEKAPVASPAKLQEFSDLQAGITPEQRAIQDTEAKMLQAFPETPDEPGWITEARNNLKKTTLSALGGQTLYDLALTHAYDHIYKPGMRYAKFAAEIVDQLGEEYLPMAAGLWDHFTSQAQERVGSLAQAIRGVQAKLSTRNQSIEDLAARSPEALRAIYDSLGLQTPDILPVKGALSAQIRSKQLAMELSNLLSGMKKLGAQTPAQAQRMLGEMSPEDATAKRNSLTTEEALAIKQAQVSKDPVLSFPDLGRETTPEVSVQDLVSAVDRIMVNNRTAEKLAGAREQVGAAKAKARLTEIPQEILSPEDWLRGLDISPEDLATRVEEITKANRLISTETYLAARAELRASLSQLNMGVSPRQLRAMAVTMAYHMENGYHKFGSFARKAIELYGDAARDNIYDLWEDTHRYVDLYAKSPVLNRLTQLPGGKQLGSIINKAAAVSFSGVDAFRRYFSLANRSPEAREIGDLLSRQESVVSRNIDILKVQLSSVHRWADRLPSKDRLEMNFALDEGQEQAKLAQLNAPADVKVLINEMRIKLADLRKEIQAVSPNALQTVVENYFPRLYKYGSQYAAAQLSNVKAGRPLETAKSFLKQRTIDSMRESVEQLGFELQSDNFVDNFVYKVTEMEKFVQMKKALEYIRKNGYEKVVNRAKIPEGWKVLDDPVSNVLKKVETPTGTEYRDQGTVRVYPSTVADLVNAHLAPSLHTEPAFRAWNAFTNFANQFQLVGLFHLALVANDAAFSMPAIGIKSLFDTAQHLYHGEAAAARGAFTEGAKAAAKSFLGPAEAVYRGHKMLQEWDKPGSNPSGDYSRRIRFAQEGGYHARMDSHFETKAIEGIGKSFRNIAEVWREADPEANRVMTTIEESANIGKKALPALLETVMRPVM